jgi:hypothetical protein
MTIQEEIIDQQNYIKDLCIAYHGSNFWFYQSCVYSCIERERCKLIKLKCKLKRVSFVM